jgi:hypothetical protein
MEINQILLWIKLALFLVATFISQSKEFKNYTFSDGLKMIVPTSYGKDVIRSTSFGPKEMTTRMKKYYYIGYATMILSAVLCVLLSYSGRGIF